MKQVVFLSGIPRSGSQVLSSLLNQHPVIYSTTTSPVADLINIINDNWPNLSRQLVNQHRDQQANIIESVIGGAYKHIDKPIIVDKNRLWPRFIPSLAAAFKAKPKIICTVRDISSVIASYILLVRKNADNISFIDKDLIAANMPVNDKNRARIIWEKYIQHPYTSLRIGYNSNQAELLFLTYEQIVNDSQTTMNRICDFLNITTITVDINNLQPMAENDEFHGGLSGLHDIRKTMRKISPSPEQVIGHELANHYKNMRLEFWNKVITS